ncbi:MAG TPA: hypothetical protein VIC34_12480 [Croceibacterium sp.]|jgi:hypothetical protein
MNLFEYLLLIVVAILIYSAWLTKHLSRNKLRADDGTQRSVTGSGREAELESEVEELRERLHVLERITVDGRETHLLSDEIEKLRDK